MKRTSLLLAAGIVSLSAWAQQRLNNSVAFGVMEQHQAAPISSAKINGDWQTIRNAHKTATTSTSRWFNYVDYLDTLTSPTGVGISANYMWNDTLSQDIYSGPTLSHNTMVSVGTVIDPNFSGFNDDLYYPSADVMHVSNTHAYTVDSVDIVGYFGINPSKTAVVDTITIGYVYGSGATGSSAGIYRSYFTNATVLARYGLPSTDSLFFKDIDYDSTKNEGSGTNYHSQKIYVSATGVTSNSVANWYDTLGNGAFYKAVKLNTPMSVPAGNMIAFTISYKSGDAAFVTDDTVFTGNAGPGLYRYNMFRPWVAFNGGSTPSFATYSHTDNNEGLFKTLPNFANGWMDTYVPQWAWTASGGGASTLQYPYIGAKITCPTCVISVPNVPAIANVVNVYPNPANEELRISFSLTGTANTTVSLTNMVGQVVASQSMGNVANGAAIFNTSAIPAGVYVYTVLSNGTRTTGRVVVAH